MAAFGISLLFVGIISYITYYIIKYLKLRNLINKIPCPRPFLLTGNLHQFHPNPSDWFSQSDGLISTYVQNGRGMGRLWISLIPYVTVFEPKLLEVVLSNPNKHLNKTRDYDLLQPWLGLGLLTSPGWKWRPRRKLLTPAFHYDILKDFVYIFNEQARIVIKKLESVSGKGPTDPYPYLTLCALDVICKTAMGQSLGTQENEQCDYVKAIHAINRIVHERQKQPWMWSDVIFRLFGEGVMHDWALSVVHGFSEKVIKERYEEIKLHGGLENMITATTIGGKRRYAFLDLLLDMVEKKQLPFEEVRSEVDTFMFEGHDTTATGMNWCLYLLSCYPEIQAKVHAELDEVFGDDDRDITHEDLPQLQYLERCIKEALRLFPSVPIMTRVLDEDVEIGGYKIPAGIGIGMSPYITHRIREHWPDPEVFDPDRFLPENCAKRHPFAYIPFSAGNRNCIGQRFALMEEKSILAWILRYYRVDNGPRRDLLRPQAELILRESRGIHLDITLRRKLPEL